MTLILIGGCGLCADARQWDWLERFRIAEDVKQVDIVFHYPPELTQLLVQTIPLLCPSKRDVLTFFRGAGVGGAIFADLETRPRNDRNSTSGPQAGSRQSFLWQPAKAPLWQGGTSQPFRDR